MASHEADAADGPADGLADDACVLQLLVEAWLGAAIIGRGGGTVRRLTRESGVRSIHLSHHDAASQRAQGGDRTVSISGSSACVKHAYRLIAQLLRTEAELPPDARSAGGRGSRAVCRPARQPGGPPARPIATLLMQLLIKHVSPVYIVHRCVRERPFIARSID